MSSDVRDSSSDRAPTLSTERLERAYDLARAALLDERTSDGHWVGELSTSALSTATAISALAVLGAAPGGDRVCSPAERQRLIDGGLAWLDAHQNDDGGFGDTDLSLSNISTTLLVLAAWKAAGAEADRGESIAAARAYVERCGGIPGLRRRYGRDKTFAVPILANAAIAGSVPWREVSALPFEAACVPQSWYRFMSLPVVSYAIPALVAIGQAKHSQDPTWFLPLRWLRAASIGRSRRVLARMQPASGGVLEAVPLTSFVIMGLATAGGVDDPVTVAGVRFLKESVRDDGSWPIDTNLATWTTDLAIGALAIGDRGDEATWAEGRLIDWVLACQHRTRHPFTGADPGGWGWTDLSGAVPDADDTPAALLALDAWRRLGRLDESRRKQAEQAASAGADWLLGLQNRDGGWPTFCRGWGKLPFDRSGSDLTAHAMRALHAWRDVLGAGRIAGPIERGWRYLTRQQRADGSWLPLWFGNQDEADDENPIYGTVKVLAAFRDLDRGRDPAAGRALRWLLGRQRADGSWGGGASVRQRQGDSDGSIEETALATELLASWADRFSGEGLQESTEARRAALGGLEWLVARVEAGRFRTPSPIGFYFAKLWYHERLYPLIYAVSALGRARATGIVR
ncbi:MAG TPA: squalene--hopene cyclase [Planctomycetaceae bacterium]|nr:squalene--hopene cyclase [Planctomycetaceae bacterium]